jgi:hypothetical protein
VDGGLITCWVVLNLWIHISSFLQAVDRAAESADFKMSLMGKVENVSVRYLRRFCSRYQRLCSSPNSPIFCRSVDRRR